MSLEKAGGSSVAFTLNGGLGADRRELVRALR
jgi:hypothetical protein